MNVKSNFQVDDFGFKDWHFNFYISVNRETNYHSPPLFQRVLVVHVPLSDVIVERMLRCNLPLYNFSIIADLVSLEAYTLTGRHVPTKLQLW
jgi:hypothetical protein